MADRATVRVEGRVPPKPTDNRKKAWTYQRYEGPGDPVWAIMAGDLIVALVKEKGDADLICRVKGEATRLAADARRNQAKIRGLAEENKLLMTALRRITEIVQKCTSPMEVINAKSEVARLMKKMMIGGRGA